MAKATGLSLSSVQRIWQAHQLQPHRLRTFKRSRDPLFVAKLVDVVGLYLDPPAHTVVLSIDGDIAVVGLTSGLRRQSVVRHAEMNAVCAVARTHDPPAQLRPPNPAPGHGDDRVAEEHGPLRRLAHLTLFRRRFEAKVMTEIMR